MSKQRFISAINHIETDRPPIDLGATAITGIHAHTLSKLAENLGFKHKKIFVYEVFQQLGYVDEDLRQALEVDVVGLLPYKNFTGALNDDFLVDYPIPYGGIGSAVKGFKYEINSSGRYAYPVGGNNPSLHMPSSGCFFDNIDRSTTVCDDDSDPYEDFKGCFEPMNDDEANYYKEQAQYFYDNCDYGVISNLAPAAFGDAAFMPGANLIAPKGIRALQEWYLAHKLCPDYVKAVYDMHYKCAIKNIEILNQAVGNKIDCLVVSGTDFGMQNSTLISQEDFREFYKPLYKSVNDYIHKNTKWKTFFHSCGSIIDLLDDFVECGVDIINPVQCSAKGMDAKLLKEKYNKSLVFWGGGVDTQKVLPFMSSKDCAEMVRERIKIFSKDGGFVFNAVHNILANSPIENVIACYNEAKKIQL